MATGGANIIIRGTMDMFQMFRSKENEEKKFFFVRGYQKSGTNWVQNVLNLHPKIIARGEFHFFIIRGGINHFLGANGFTQQFKKITQEHFEGLVKGCLLENTKEVKRNTLYHGDVSPWYLTDDIDYHIMLKDAPYIIINRDARDILVSQIYHRLRHISNKNFDPEFTSLLSDFPSLREKSIIFEKDNTYFDINSTQLLNDEAYVKNSMTHWSNHIKAQKNWVNKIKAESKKVKIHFIKYENLHSNFKEEKDKLYQFLNLDPHEAQEAGDLEMPGFKKVNNLSHNRKGIVEDWKNYFTEEQCQWVKEVAGEALIESGYEKDLNWDHKPTI